MRLIFLRDDFRYLSLIDSSQRYSISNYKNCMISDQPCKHKPWLSLMIDKLVINYNAAITLLIALIHFFNSLKFKLRVSIY